MTATALVTLHDATHRIPHVRLVCLSCPTGTAVVATPWPEHLPTFALAVTTAQGTTWLDPPAAFVVFEVDAGAGPPDRIAVVPATLPADLDGVRVLATLGRAQFEQQMQQHPDPVQAMAAIDPDAFGGLTPAHAGPAGLHPPAGGAPATALTAPATVPDTRPTPRPQFPTGICHLLGWD